MAKKRNSITHQIMRDVIDINKRIPHELTRKIYIRNTGYFVKWCRKTYNVKSLEECKQHLQDYANVLYLWAYSPSTIHTYLASACSTLGVCLKEIDIPRRKTALYTRGRSEPKFYSINTDLDHERWSYLVRFAKVVGLRRSEYMKLKSEDFEIDENGNAYVLVRNGKGGKFQKQHILPKDVDFVKGYFDRTPLGQRIFKKELFMNNLNLHKIRAEHAKEYYEEEVRKIKNIPGYREQLIQRLRDYWNEYNINPKTGKPRPFPEKYTKGYYVLRGENRTKALAENKNVYFDKLAAFSTSCFSLSHYRLSVTIESYLTT